MASVVKNFDFLLMSKPEGSKDYCAIAGFNTAEQAYVYASFLLVLFDKKALEDSILQIFNKKDVIILDNNDGTYRKLEPTFDQNKFSDRN